MCVLMRPTNLHNFLLNYIELNGDKEGERGTESPKERKLKVINVSLHFNAVTR